MKNGNLKDSEIKAIKNDIAQRGISDTAECNDSFKKWQKIFKRYTKNGICFEF